MFSVTVADAELQPLEDDSQRSSADDLPEVDLFFVFFNFVSFKPLKHEPSGWKSAQTLQTHGGSGPGIPASGVLEEPVTCSGGHVTIRCPAK